jgi:hypothetical protein
MRKYVLCLCTYFLAYFAYFEKKKQAFEIPLLSVSVSVYPPYLC